ncbi:unnamed protein product [Zymoseptoria tritici ST99CH_3D1]|uniref:Enoyl reductase (ER) domain-containing protein n=1 Tax=Zymoseptoria tritici ST99CH_1E4 TaxID=1276532 RepID=A0A2H1GPA2_ZYMTR|nr:unnamed protein product [Zymoseptoria tritici ST99CH_1E4]SMR57772.1 unnamed protein product [Zymoseptoria tritici ST99CH_3D1]
MRVWRYSSTDGGLENNIKLHLDAPLPKATKDGHLIQVLAVSLNPVDYKPTEAFIGRFVVKKPATPGFDIAGRIFTPATNSRDFKAGDLVFGAASTNPLAGGALAEYIVAPASRIVHLPSGISPIEAAGIPVAAVTAHDALIPYITSGSRVFINGGSGGVGTFAIQLAKLLGAHVTVSCSTRNVALCRSLGADNVLDYTTGPLLAQLKAAEKPFDHVVDNVFSDPELYFQMHKYTTPKAVFAEVASGPTLSFAKFAAGALLVPKVLGGGRRKFVVIAADLKAETLKELAQWVAEQKVKVVVDQVFGMEEVVAAYQKQKTGRVVGKLVVDVAGEAGRPTKQ